MAQTQETTSPTSTVIPIPPPAKNMSRETTLSPSSPSKQATGLDVIRQKLQPLLLYVVSTAQFLDIVNGASVAVAILPIAKDLHFSVPQMTWIINAYTVAFAGLLLFSGRLGDLFGHRRVFLFGLFWFATWALVVSFSTSPIMFVISRALQGVGAANTVPSAMALIATTYPAGPERTKAFSVFAAFGGLGAVVGILMAGGLISSIGWAWIFRISSIAAYFLLVLGFLVIPSAPPKSVKPKIDYIGAATATLGVTGIVYYITTGVEDGWAVGKTLPVFIVGVLLIASFIFVESKVESPLMPLRIWKSKRFTSSVILAFVQMAMFQGVIYFANMVFQEVYQWSAIQTALGFLVHSLLAVVVFTALGRIMPRLHLKPLILVGFLLRCGTALLFSFIDEHTSYWRFAFPAFIIHIFGVGFSMLPIQITAIRDADNKDQGLVGAIYNTGLQLGAPFGLAILNVIAVSANRDVLDSGVHSGPTLMKGYRNAFYGMIALGLFGFVLTAIILPWDKPQRPAQKPTAETKDLEVGSPVEVNEEKMLDGDEEVLGSSSFSSSSKAESDANTIATQIDAADTYKEQNKA